MASAFIFVAQGPVAGQDAASQLELSKGAPVTLDTVAPGDAFAPGSPEERYLRDHTRYLTHGFGGPTAMIWQLLVSIVLNLLLFSLAITVVAVPVGWVFGHLIPAFQA